jgi:hypothetical protein
MMKMAELRFAIFDFDSLDLLPMTIPQTSFHYFILGCAQNARDTIHFVPESLGIFFGNKISFALSTYHERTAP